MKKKQPSVTAKQGVSADYGGWELHNELGAGGNGIVYEAHRGSERAALKVLRKSYWKGIDSTVSAMRWPPWSDAWALPE